MISSISSLSKIDIDKKKVLLLGDMKELGDDEVLYHQELLDLIAENEWSFVGLVGPVFRKADIHNQYVHFDSIQSLNLYPDLTDILQDSVCLIKGSRSIRMEDLSALA